MAVFELEETSQTRTHPKKWSLSPPKRRADLTGTAQKSILGGQQSPNRLPELFSRKLTTNYSALQHCKTQVQILVTGSVTTESTQSQGIRTQNSRVMIQSVYFPTSIR